MADVRSESEKKAAANFLGNLLNRGLTFGETILGQRLAKNYKPEAVAPVLQREEKAAQAMPMPAPTNWPLIGGIVLVVVLIVVMMRK